MGEPTSAQKFDSAWVDAFVERWGNAWNAHDRAQVLELLTDDIVYDDSASPTTMRGKADVRELLDLTWRAFPDLTFELIAGPTSPVTAPAPPTGGKRPPLTRARSTHPASPPPAHTSNSTASTSTNTATAKSPHCGSSAT